MGLSENEGDTSNEQPEGGLLSLVGDMLFAGAILVMMYPTLHRTIKRVDRQFCRQFMQVTQVIVPLAALSFVLMLMIAQQTRMAYCSLVRPLVGDQPEEGALYASILLKVLFCVLLVFNYFCACRLQRFVGQYFPSFQTRETAGRRGSAFSATASWRTRSQPTGEAAYPSNSNTNSPTSTYSDIFSTISNSPVPDSVSLEEQSHTTERRLFCDVGTMVRFPEYQRSWCPLQSCQDQVVQCPGGCCHQNSSVPNPRPCSPSSPFPSSTAGSSGFCAVPPTGVFQQDAAGAGSSHQHVGSGWAPVAPAQVTSGPQCASSGVAHVPSSSTIRTRLRSASSTNNSSNRQMNVALESSPAETWRCPNDPRAPRGDENIINTSSIHSSVSSAVAYPSCSFRCPSVTSSSSQTPSRGLARQGIGGAHVKRRCHPLPTMIKMTRSGKIYGYG